MTGVYPQHTRRWAATLAVILCWVATPPANSAGLDALGLGEPSLDGVRAGLRRDADDRLEPFVFEAGRDWPALRFRTEAALDWRGAAALALPVDNPGSTSFQLLLRLDDSAAATGDDRTLNGLVTLPPHTSVTLVLPLAATPGGMRGRPLAAVDTQSGDLLVPDIRGGVDASHIVALHVSGTHLDADHVLRIGAPALRPRRSGSAPAASAALADRFGQSLAGGWPEKVESEADLRRKLATAADQTRRLAAAAPPRGDRWGGLAEKVGPATGFFRTAKPGGRWSLVTPEGHAFLSIGMDVVSPVNETVVEGREKLFDGLPGRDDPLARFYGTIAGRRTFDVGGANLERSLGADWRRRWPEQTVARLAAWGVNTLGAWSDPALDAAMPHVVVYDVEGTGAAVPMRPDRSLPDPFDPAFAALAETAATAMTAGRARDAGLLGYFSGNELPWGEPGELAARVLALGADSPARQAFLADLRTLHGSPDALARSWGLPGLASFEALHATPPRPTPTAQADISAFEERFADAYFSTVAAAIHRHDPHHIYLGARFGSATPAAVGACARWCDVLSFNYYGASPDERSALWRSLDRPVLLGEFHFGSLDRGSFWPGMTGVKSEADRGPAYARFLADAVRDPSVVGIHWYQYADQPLTGRPFDGENGHIGFVTVADVPYAGFVDAAAAANREAMVAFAGQIRPPRQRSAIP